jgi:hypothetical protein
LRRIASLDGGSDCVLGHGSCATLHAIVGQHAAAAGSVYARPDQMMYGPRHDSAHPARTARVANCDSPAACGWLPGSARIRPKARMAAELLRWGLRRSTRTLRNRLPRSERRKDPQCSTFAREATCSSLRPLLEGRQQVRARDTRRSSTRLFKIASVHARTHPNTWDHVDRVYQSWIEWRQLD